MFVTKDSLGSLWSPMLLILCLYNRSLVIARLSIGERPTFNFEVIHYKTLLDLLNLSPRFSRYAATPNLKSIQDNRSD